MGGIAINNMMAEAIEGTLGEILELSVIEFNEKLLYIHNLSMTGPFSRFTFLNQTKQVFGLLPPHKVIASSS
tara:strand:- start:82 stop:297 length:216 start_codon:yes stop_codon:yes gene_type:complete